MLCLTVCPVGCVVAGIQPFTVIAAVGPRCGATNTTQSHFFFFFFCSFSPCIMHADSKRIIKRQHSEGLFSAGRPAPCYWDWVVHTGGLVQTRSTVGWGGERRSGWRGNCASRPIHLCLVVPGVMLPREAELSTAHPPQRYARYSECLEGIQAGKRGERPNRNQSSSWFTPKFPSG